ncbi:hypothetical protein [Nonomuraea recticatena]
MRIGTTAVRRAAIVAMSAAAVALAAPPPPPRPHGTWQRPVNSRRRAAP